MTLWSDREMIEVGSKEAKACKENDILAQNQIILFTAGQELAYWEKLLNIDIDQEKCLYPICNVSTLIWRKLMQDGVLESAGGDIPLHGLDNILQALKILRTKCNLRAICLV